mmetsp:Transcript_5333/g.7684  ORF Transcript_5333/g.7684 Transcript_5333/m.7684 type:complete len:304 (-) Transcript_5333:763-1674(-)
MLYRNILLCCLLFSHSNGFATAFSPISQGGKTMLEERTRVSSTISDTVLDYFNSYESAAVNAGLITDILTCGTFNTVSDTVAQFLTGNIELQNDRGNSQQNNRQSREDDPIDTPYDSGRTLRLALFGLADGAVSHIWFLTLDSVVGDGQGLSDTLLKTAADALLYTPLWCAWFLAFITIIEPGTNPITTRFQSIFSVWRSDWLELFQGNLGFFLPLTGLIYGYVPREERVLAFGLASLIYTTILSLWNQSRGKDDTVVPVVNMELCDVDDPDKECVPVPRPPRAVLPFRLRRVVVKAQRYIFR